MDLDRLMRISNVLSTEKCSSEVVRYLALNVCTESLPAILYISKVTEDLKFHHFLSFGVSESAIEATKVLDATQVPLFNKLISSNEILIGPLNNAFFLQFKGVQIDYRAGWKSLVILPLSNKFIVAFVFQVELDSTEDNQAYFSLLRALLSVYLNHLDSPGPDRETHPAKLKHESFGDELTARQIEIHAYIKSGLTNGTIAIKMGYSESLIKQETMAIYQKLGIVGRRQIINSD